MNPDDFFKKWIPKLYHLNPDDDLYKKACYTELERHIPPDLATRETMEKNWYWGGKKEKYPNYLPVILAKADKEYAILEILGDLPLRSIRREYNS